MKISLVGTGLMGFPMAQRLLKNGYELTVFNRTAGKVGLLVEQGARLAGDPREAVMNSDVIILMLSDFKAVNETMLSAEIQTSLAEKTIIQMGTIAPDDSRRLMEKFSDYNAEYLEAPVLGSIQQVKAGELFILAGSTKKQFNTYESLFKIFGSTVYHIGEVGKASALKLALNQLIASLTASFSLSLGLVLHAGVDPDIFMRVLRNSALYAPTFDKKLDNMKNRNFIPPNFPVKHLLKDVDLILNSSSKAGLNTAQLEGVRKILVDAIEKGLKEEDYSALYNAVNPAT
ncbi:MAG: NAD(P)-dependent oxidoreductase [Calditrichaceae bacterium]